MKLGEGVEAAIHCMTMLAGLSEGATLPGAALAEYHGVSPSYLLKHLKSLATAGLLNSVPGPAGGYRLARPANAITLADIVVAVEGVKPAFRCANIRCRGPGALAPSDYPHPCGINTAMLKAETAYRAALAETSLADLVSEFTETAPPRAVERGRHFVERHQRGRS